MSVACVRGCWVGQRRLGQKLPNSSHFLALALPRAEPDHPLPQALRPLGAEEQGATEAPDARGVRARVRASDEAAAEWVAYRLEQAGRAA